MSNNNPTSQDQATAPTAPDRRYSKNPSIRLGADERLKLLALIDAGVIRDLATMVRASIEEHFARMQARVGMAWPEAVVPALLLAPTATGVPYTCPFTGETLVGRVGLAILPGPVLGPYVSARFLTDETLLRAGSADTEDSGPAPLAVPMPSSEDGSEPRH